MYSDKPQTAHTRRRRRGFSLVEVMVVIVIIGLLAGAVTIKVSDYVERAKTDRVKSDISTIVSAIESYKATHGAWPTSDQGLSVLPLKTTKDPWGRPYLYICPGTSSAYEVICYGRDGREGGEGIDRDLSSEDWQETET